MDLAAVPLLPGEQPLLTLPLVQVVPSLGEVNVDPPRVLLIGAGADTHPVPWRWREGWWELDTGVEKTVTHGNERILNRTDTDTHALPLFEIHSTPPAKFLTAILFLLFSSADRKIKDLYPSPDTATAHITMQAAQKVRLITGCECFFSLWKKSKNESKN